MFAILLLLGLLLTATGIFAIGFGIPIHDFTLGDTLIMAGASGVAGGLVLVGVAFVVRELRNLAAGLKVGARPIVQPVDVAPRPEPRVRPARSSEVHQQEQPPEPAEPPISEPAPAPQPAERPRPNIFAVARGAQAPLIPSEVPARPRAEPARAIEPRLPTRAEPSAHVAPPKPAERAGDRPRPNLFDSVWPNTARPEKSAHPDARGASLAQRDAPEIRDDGRGELRIDPNSEAADAPLQAAQAGGEPRPAILKSGVIDGMAYTLYADGSIEAQLPQGVVRFASIDDLRAHIEQGG